MNDLMEKGSEARRRGFYDGVRASIQWLHLEALRMNDPHARAVLNTAAYHLGVNKPDPALSPPPVQQPVEAASGIDQNLISPKTGEGG